MGTQTALSIGKARPYRHNYVLTRSGKAPFEDVMMYPVASIQEAVNRYLAVCSGNEREVRIYVCGGEEVYRSMIPYLTGLHMTVVYEPPAKPHDRFFPNDETFIYHGVKEEFASGNWIMDGKDERIRTFYSHVRFRRHEGAPLLSLPSNVQLARAS
jgi:dihydrofolate reductase